MYNVELHTQSERDICCWRWRLWCFMSTFPCLPTAFQYLIVSAGEDKSDPAEAWSDLHFLLQQRRADGGDRDCAVLSPRRLQLRHLQGCLEEEECIQRCVLPEIWLQRQRFFFFVCSLMVHTSNYLQRAMTKKAAKKNRSYKRKVLWHESLINSPPECSWYVVIFKAWHKREVSRACIVNQAPTVWHGL